MTRPARLVPALMIVATALLAAQQPQRPPQAPTFRSGTQTVSVYATATQEGRVLTNLQKEDFEVLDDGAPQEISLFSNEIQPISLVIMLDMSGSMSGSLGLLRAGAVQLFTDLLPGDKVRVGSFADRIILSDKFTSDQDELIHSLYLDLPQTGQTPLWAAISMAMTALTRVEGRRVVLVFTDGYNTRPQPTFKEVLQRVQIEEFMVYGVGLWGHDGLGHLEPPDPGLRDLTFESGGGYFELRNAQGIGPAFRRVAEELHRQYLLAFRTTAQDGRLHKLEVRVKTPGVLVRARKSYQAPRPPAKDR